MSRSVIYSVIPKVNPRNREAEPKYYASAKARGDINIREMAERIQQTCTVTKADVFAVLVALEDVIVDALRNGEIVRLMDIGAFQILLRTTGAVTEEDFTVENIKRARINFRPGSALANAITGLTFTKVARTPTEEETGEEETGEEETTA